MMGVQVFSDLTTKTMKDPLLIDINLDLIQLQGAKSLPLLLTIPTIKGCLYPKNWLWLLAGLFQIEVLAMKIILLGYLLLTRS